MAKKKSVKDTKDLSKNSSKNSSKSDKDESKLFAFLATFLSIIGFVIALIAKRDNEYVMYYAKQSLVIFIMLVILGAVAGIFKWIPVIGWIIYAAVTILSVVVWIMSWLYALSGKEKTIPVISEWAEKISL